MPEKCEENITQQPSNQSIENVINQQNQINQSPCEITNDKRDCARYDFNVIFPKGGEQFCLGETINIQWKAPKDFDILTVKLIERGYNTTAYNIRTFPANYNEIEKINDEGTVLWTIPLSVKEGMAYEIWINSVYQNHSINAVSDKAFSIINCRG